MPQFSSETGNRDGPPASPFPSTQVFWGLHEASTLGMICFAQSTNLRAERIRTHPERMFMLVKWTQTVSYP